MAKAQTWCLVTSTLKAWGHWRCWRCGFQGLLPDEAAPVRSERSRRVLQVHHRDRDRTNNALYNLEVVCAACHLGTHRGERFGRRVVAGQLRLAIALASVPPVRRQPMPLTPLQLPLKVPSVAPTPLEVEQLTLI